MDIRFEGKSWSILIPKSWNASQDDVCTTFVTDNEIGALQISSAYKNTPVLDSDLLDFAADHLETGAVRKPMQAGAFLGFEICFLEADHWWRMWYLRNSHQLLFVTYNCNIEAKGVDDDGVDEVLSTLGA